MYIGYWINFMVYKMNIIFMATYIIICSLFLTMVQNILPHLYKPIFLFEYIPKGIILTSSKENVDITILLTYLTDKYNIGINERMLEILLLARQQLCHLDIQGLELIENVILNQTHLILLFYGFIILIILGYFLLVFAFEKRKINKSTIIQIVILIMTLFINNLSMLWFTINLHILNVTFNILPSLNISLFLFLIFIEYKDYINIQSICFKIIYYFIYAFYIILSIKLFTDIYYKNGISFSYIIKEDIIKNICYMLYFCLKLDYLSEDFLLLH